MRKIGMENDSIQLKYTIEGVSKILVPRDQIYFPRRSRGEIGLVKGNQNLANFRNGILKLFYHTETNIKLLDA